MATKTKNSTKRVADPVVVTTNTPSHKMLEVILSNKREYLLSKTAEDTLAMMNKVRDLFVKYGSRAKVVRKLIEQMPEIDESTAWRYVLITPQVMAVVPQESTRNFWVDIHMEKIEETYQAAKDAGDTKAMAMCNRDRAVAIEKFCGTKEAIDPSKLNLPDVIAGFHPEWFKDVPMVDTPEYEMLIQQFRTTNDRRNKMQILDIDYEELYDAQ